MFSRLRNVTIAPSRPRNGRTRSNPLSWHGLHKNRTQHIERSVLTPSHIMRTLLLALILSLGYLILPSGAGHIPRKNGKVPRDFVTTNGRNFELNGKPFVRIFRTVYWSFAHLKHMSGFRRCKLIC